jgi:hypothetical protein
VSCSFSQSVITPGTAKVTSQLSVKANGNATATLFGSHGTFALWFPGLGFGMFVFGDRKRSRKFWVSMTLLAILVMALISTGCGGAKAASSAGGSQTSTSAAQPGTYKVSIVAQAGTFQRTTTATVTVQ